jgi:hypothetical protein
MININPDDGEFITGLTVLGATLAAVSLWLTVRIVNRRERWPKWTLAVVIGVPMLYIASFGPACWWFASDGKLPTPFGGFDFGGPYAPRIYWPVGCLLINGPQPLRDAIGWFATRRAEMVMLPYEWDGNAWVGAR